MNKEELKKETLKRLGKVLGFEPINIPIYRNQDMVNADIVVELADQYATSQTEALKKEIDELKEKIERVKNVLNDCVSRDSAVWTINTAREILYKD